jgi:hypothetical protein
MNPPPQLCSTNPSASLMVTRPSLIIPGFRVLGFLGLGLIGFVGFRIFRVLRVLGFGFRVKGFRV